jgi:hypothetical protein
MCASSLTGRSNEQVYLADDRLGSGCRPPCRRQSDGKHRSTESKHRIIPAKKSAPDYRK